jgi:2-amino-4-hydroxy-6-hydroxymethyldihydropteridine diphosphokinase
MNSIAGRRALKAATESSNSRNVERGIVPKLVDAEDARIAYVGIGSNLGDREATLSDAVRALAAHPEVRVARVSPLYETDPVGPPPQGPYLNGATELATQLAPLALLDVLQELESSAGRVREGAPRWSARTLDLDLLLYGGQLIDAPRLQVPHPHLCERGFVLEPLCQIASAVVHPSSGESVDELAARVRDPAAVRLWPSEDWKRFADEFVSDE